jgi:Heparinase II/III-like protein/Heparinase II/III N-terminus
MEPSMQEKNGAPSEFLRKQLSDRQVQRWKCYAIAESQTKPDENIFPLEVSAVFTNGSVARKDKFIQVAFQGGQGSHQVRLNLSEPFLANGIGARFRLRGWQSLRYVAFGYTHEKAFRHVKIANSARAKWIDFSIGHHDIAFGLKNDWQHPPATEISDILIYVNGTPVDGGAWLDVDSCWCWEESESSPLWVTDWLPDVPVPTSLQDIIYGYLKKNFRTVDIQAKAFMEEGRCPLYGEITLAWPYSAPLPPDLSTVNTYRFSWHSLHPAMILMMHARDSGESASLFAAREMVTNWLEQSYFQVDGDKKFAWYDHGTAERLLAMVQMWSIGLEHRFDHRFMTRLRSAIFRHGQLLASELFYASHQPTRYHNHAWFQDIALMATSLAMKDFPCAEHWLETSISRFTDQLEQLIVRDKGYAVFVENSIGYHQGVQRLVEFAGELATFAGKDSLIPTIGKELPRFSDFFRYPDNRAPAQGDTFRRSNASGTKIRRLKPYPDPACTVLPKAGYAIVKGNHDGSRFMLSVLATSLCRTHKHEDNLSFTLFFDGLEWLIDPSFYSHEYKASLPAYLRSAVAHNCLAMPGRGYSIDPGVAQINGSSDGSHFVITGQHSAYDNVLIQREIRGSIDRLELEISDCARAQTPDATGNDLRLLLHCGDGVEARLQGNHLQLTHPESKYLVEMSLPNEKCKLHFGEAAESSIRGVTGLGFMQHASIYTLECEVPFETDLPWTLRAKMSEDAL